MAEPEAFSSQVKASPAFALGSELEQLAGILPLPASIVTGLVAGPGADRE